VWWAKWIGSMVGGEKEKRRKGEKEKRRKGEKEKQREE
jgi:hypothetical protein